MLGKAGDRTSGSSTIRTGWSLRVAVMVAAAWSVLLAGACSSEDDASIPTSASTSESIPMSSSDPTVTTPLRPPGAMDCGDLNALSGWPTTTTTWPDAYACIVEAMAAGTPARMVFVWGGQGDSGRRTSDGYDLPTRRVVTWVVTGPGQLRRTTDRTDEGGSVTTETCTGLSAVSEVAAPEPTGCSPD